MNPRISALVCTHNRAPYLRKALRSLVDQTLPADQYEIIVVDNASTDETARLVRDEFGSVPNLRYVHEPRLGVSHARNTAWQRAAAPTVAYLDDDALAAEDWLERILAAFAELDETPGCLGGKVDPIWEVPKPAWLPDYLLVFLTVLDVADEPTEMPRGTYLYGTNSAFPRERLQEIGGYKADLGPIGRWHRSGEDTFVQKQLRAAGYRLHYDPRIAVRHHVQAARVTKRWLLRRMYWEGLSRARQKLHEKSPGAGGRLRLVLKAAGKVTSSPRRLLSLALPGNSPDLFERKASSCRRIGYLMGMLGSGRRKTDFSPDLPA